MFLKYFILLSSVFLFVKSSAIVKRDAAATLNDPLASLKKNMEALKHCIDQSLAMAVNDVDVEKHVQPVFNVIGDQINRLSKAFDALTASSRPDPIDS